MKKLQTFATGFAVTALALVLSSLFARLDPQDAYFNEPSPYMDAYECREGVETPYLASGYKGTPYTEINDNTPFFTEEQLTTKAFELYSKLDSLGRCGEAFACLGPETLPTEERGSIGQVKPSGWHTVKYKGIDGNYLYNRCHLIAFSLSGENANEENLITGTRYMNTEGMLPFEMQVLDYIRETGNHVLYRATPIFLNDNLIAEGVQIEALSVEDGGTLSFNVFCYNVQPGITIDYATGESSGPAYE